MDVAEKVPFSTWLGLRRKGLGLTQAQLAARVACSTVSIRKIENGDLKPGEQLAQLLARALAVPDPMRDAFVHFSRSASEMQLLTAFRMPPAAVEPVAGPRLPPLPAPLGGLLGRDAGMGRVMALARSPDVHLVTFTGAPGVGKSRLCLEVARALEHEYANGAVLVRLDAVTSPLQVVPAIATALGLGTSAASTTDALGAWLRRRNLLLVLDNFEHVLGAAGDVRGILEQADGCKALVTSRVALRVYGEHEVVVPPLAVRDDAGRAGPAVELFLQRAHSVKFGFSPDAATLATIGEICAAVDGLPLAIEMAASAMRSATPQEVLAQLKQSRTSFGALRRNAPARQLSLRAMLDWSHGLLSPHSQRVLRATAIFAGEFTEQAMHAVLRHDEGPDATQRALIDLVDHSLLNVGADDGWFSPLAVVRDYAAALPAQPGEREELAVAHAAWCREICTRQRALHEVTVSAPEWVMFGRNMPDIERALDWLMTGGEGAGALDMLMPVLRWAEMRDRLGAYGPMLERALALAPDHGDAVYGHMWLALVHAMHGDPQRALMLCDAIYPNLDGAATARETYEFLRNAALVRLRLVGWEAAAPIVDRAVAHVQGAGLSHEQAILQQLQALIARDSGDFALGARLMHAQLTELRQRSDLAGLGLALYTTATCELNLGNIAAARAAAEEALTLELAHGADRRIVQILEVLAWIAARDREAAIAARKLGGALAYRERSKVNLSQRQMQWREAAMTRLRDALGDAGFEQAHAAGAALTDAEIVREAV